MSNDPQPFEEDLEVVEMQAVPDEAAEPLAKPGKKKKEKKPKVKKPKAPKAPKAPKPPRQSSGKGFSQILREQFPDVYTPMLGLSVLALVVAILLLLLEIWIGYGGEIRAPKAMASPPAKQAVGAIGGGRLG